jgi:GTP cyclohydrolase I
MRVVSDEFLDSEEGSLTPSPDLLQQAIETRYPSPFSDADAQLDNEQKVLAIADRFREIMEILGLDLTDPSLEKSPLRVAEMYVNEIFSGMDPSTFPKMTFMTSPCREGEISNMVVVKAGFTSFCEHHFVPMVGHAYVSYIPKEKVIGLSKIPRLVQFFAKRPQLQERLTVQIADSLATLLETEDVAVVIKATHHCVLARGVQDSFGMTTTHAFKGQFQTNPSIKHEFFQSIQ